MNTSEVLNRAADLIEERGWEQIQGWATDNTSGVCLEGALQGATGLGLAGYDRVLKKATRPLYECPAFLAMRSYLEVRETVLYGWNDAPQRTQAEVIEALRACAVIEAAKERADVEVSA